MSKTLKQEEMSKAYIGRRGGESFQAGALVEHRRVGGGGCAAGEGEEGAGMAAQVAGSTSASILESEQSPWRVFHSFYV